MAAPEDLSAGGDPAPLTMPVRWDGREHSCWPDGDGVGQAATADAISPWEAPLPLHDEQEQRCWLGQALGSLLTSLDAQRSELISRYGHAGPTEACIEAVFRRADQVFQLTVVASQAGCQRQRQVLSGLPRTFRPVVFQQRGTRNVAEEHHYLILQDEHEEFSLYRRTEPRVYPLCPDGSVDWSAACPASPSPSRPSVLHARLPYLLGMLLILTVSFVAGHRDAPFPSLGADR